jgi:glycosyltransferase involved in cell wall biosynthesis
MMDATPAVSVIIAAHQARGFIGAAVASALAQDVPLEIVVAPDEPRAAADYRYLQDLDARIRVLEPVPASTGPGPARNRALAVARGEFVALLDADDLWSPNYLARLLPLAMAEGAAFGRTAITDWQGHHLRAVTAPHGAATFATFETAFASFHGLAPRQPVRGWRDVLAEDVLFDLETLSLNGGQAPYADDAVYHLRLRPASLTRSDGFIRDIAAGYDRLVAMIDAGETAVRACDRAAVAAVFRRWQAVNARFEMALSESADLTYQAFVNRILPLEGVG